MREYGLGIYRKYKNKYDLKNIQITIVQPRGDHSQGPIRSEEFSIRDLIQWGRKVLKPAIKLSESKNPLLIAGDKQCEWCEASALCEKYASYLSGVAQQDFKSVAVIKTNQLPEPNTLTKKEIKAILDHENNFSNWFKKVKAYAQTAMEGGENIYEYKLVERISNRKYNKEKRLVRALKRNNIYDAYEPLKLKSPAQLEMHLAIATDWPKAEIKEFVNRYTERTVTGVTIANTKDGRPEIQPTIETDFADEVAKKPKRRKTRRTRK